MGKLFINGNNQKTETVSLEDAGVITIDYKLGNREGKDKESILLNRF